MFADKPGFRESVDSVIANRTERGTLWQAVMIQAIPDTIYDLGRFIQTASVAPSVILIALNCSRCLVGLACFNLRMFSSFH